MCCMDTIRKSWRKNWHLAVIIGVLLCHDLLNRKIIWFLLIFVIKLLLLKLLENQNKTPNSVLFVPLSITSLVLYFGKIIVMGKIMEM